MRPKSQALTLLASLALTGCATPVGPIEVSRFHLVDISPLGRGTIAVMPGAGMDPASLEVQSYETAVAGELTRLGYATNTTGAGNQLAMVRITRQSLKPAAARSPVSVGVGGSAGSYGSGLGIGIGIDLSGGPKPQVATELSVTIRDAASGKSLWEGRASITVAASSPLANSQLAAPKLAQALFTNFPGQSGETITIKP